jgi:hypothetical protein
MFDNCRIIKQSHFFLFQPGDGGDIVGIVFGNAGGGYFGGIP